MAAGLGTASLRVVANTTVFEQTLKRSLKRMSALTAGIFAGAAAGNFLGGAVKNAIALEKQVALVQTMLRDQPQIIKDAFNAESIRELSNEVGISADKVADSLYYIIGSGVPAAKAMDAFRAASAAAVGTNSDVALTANFTTTALNAYREEVDTLTGQSLTAAHANDIFVKSIMEGKGTANDMAKYISSVISPASALGVGLGEIAAAGSAATLTGKSARKVFTGLQYVMTGLGDTSKGLGEAFQDITGKSFKQFVKEGGTLKDAIKIIGTEIGDAQLANLAGAKQGTLGVQELLNVWGQYETIQKKMAGAEGEAAKARDLVNESTSRQLDFLKTEFQNFRGSVGDWLLPVILRGLAAFDAFKPKMAAFVEGLKPVWAKIVGVFDGPINEVKMVLQSIDWAGIKEIIVGVFTGIMIGLAPFVLALGVVVGVFAALLNIIHPVVAVMKEFMPLIIAGVAIWTAYTVAQNLGVVATVAYWTISKALIITEKARAIATGVMTAVQIIAIGATSGLAGAMTALNLVIMANPVGFLIAALVALGAAFYLAWGHSEKFRNAVVATWNAIKDATLQVVKILIDVIITWLKAPIMMLKKVLDAWAHAPDWLGGGKASEAAGAVQNILDGINDMKDGIQELIDRAQAADWAISNIGQGGVSMSHEGQLPPGAALAAKKAEQAAAAAQPKIPSFSGGGWSPDAKADAKKAASDAAKEIKAAMGRIKADLKRIAKSTSKQTTDTIKQNFDQLYADMKDAKVSKAMIAAAKKQEAALLKLAKKRDKNTIAMDKEEAKLKKLTDSYKATVKDMMHAFSDLGNITNTEQMRTVFRQGIFPSASNQIQNLKRALYISDRFAAAIKKLQKLGLKKTSLDQLIAAGPEAGLGAAEGLAAGGKSAVKQVNGLQDQLNTNGKALGTSLAEQFYGHGIEISEGLLKGLEKDQDKLLKAMDKLGDAMAAAFKKKLGIHSPSKVFEGFGENITAGLGIGIAGSVGRANGPTPSASAAVTFGPGSVVVNGVKNGDEQKGGMLTGRGIVGVLESRSTAAALAGIGG